MTVVLQKKGCFIVNVLIKLKDYDLIEIRSEMDTETVYDFYGDYETAIQYMTFKFSDGMCIEFKIDDRDCCSFCFIASFFYGKDFSEMTKAQFVDSFKAQMYAKIINEYTEDKKDG